MIGSFGTIVFIASSEKVRTFEDFERTTASRWTVHDVHLKHPIAEYVGPGQDMIKFSMWFDIRYGMNPRQEMDGLLVLCRSGKPETLTIGGKALGVHKWYIESVDQQYEYFDNKGNVIRGRANVIMKEYVR